MDNRDLRIVLVGKTGAGKSSAVNTIFRRKDFPVSATTESLKVTGEFEGKTLAVVDTPGLMNDRLHEEQVKREISRSMFLAAPGPHVILMVIPTGRFTKEEQEAMKIIQQMFGEEAAASTVVLFTRGDDLEVEGTDIDKFISDNPALSEFISQCGGRRHVFNNRKNDPSQVRELLKKINTMVQRNGGIYKTEDMFRRVERAKQEETKIRQRGNAETTSEESKRRAHGERSSKQAGPAAVYGGPEDGVGGETGEIGNQELRIVLVGKTGVGKSSSGNTILERKAFLSATTECQRETGEFEGQPLALIDTPGLLNTRLTEEQVTTEISRCISLAAPGPHVILVVLQGGRFIEEDQEIVKTIQKMLGKEAERHIMVLFTCGGDLKADGDTIEDIISNDEALRSFILKCKQQYHVFENRDRDPSQVRELLKKIRERVQANGRRCYSIEMFKKTERAIREAMERRQRENRPQCAQTARGRGHGNQHYYNQYEGETAIVKCTIL